MRKTLPSQRSAYHFLRLVVVVLAVLPIVYAQPATQSTDSLLGKWRGEAGTADNRAVFGFEFIRDGEGLVNASYYQDNMGYAGVNLGTVKVSAVSTFEIPDAEIKLTLDGQRLHAAGLLGEAGALVEFARADSLPIAMPMPDVPAGAAPRWQQRLGGAIYATVAVHDDVVYVGNTDGVFYAVKLADGAIAWTFAAGRPIYGEALATADAIYVVCDNGYLYRLDRASGKVRWRYDLGDSRVSRIPPNPKVFDYDRQSPRPVLKDDVIYVGSGDGHFHAVRATTGKRVWRVGTVGKIRTAAVIDGTNVIFATIHNAGGGVIHAVNRLTGKRVWRYDAKAPVTTVPAIAGDILIVGTRGANTRLLGLDAKSGSVKWSQYYWGSWVESEAVISGDSVYMGSGDLFAVSAIDPAIGRNRWRTNVHGWVLARVAVTNDFVYAGVSSARRHADTTSRQVASLTKLNRHTGDIVSRWPMPEWPGAFLNGFVAAPVVVGKQLVIGGVNGALTAFDVN